MNDLAFLILALRAFGGRKQQAMSAVDIEVFRGRLSLTLLLSCTNRKNGAKSGVLGEGLRATDEVLITFCVSSMDILTNVPIGSNPLRQFFYPHEPQTAQDIYG